MEKVARAILGNYQGSDAEARVAEITKALNEAFTRSFEKVFSAATPKTPAKPKT